MHVLTKIFIVLVTLMAVGLVPLVVVYAHNEDSYKAKADDYKLRESVANQNLAREQTRAGEAIHGLEAQLQEEGRKATMLRSQLATKENEINDLQGRLVTAESLQAEIMAKLSTLTTSVDAGQDLTDSLITELRDLRGDLMRQETQMVELDDALRERTSQVEVAEATIRALREEVTRLTGEQANAMRDLAEYTRQFGAISDRVGDSAHSQITEAVTATVVQVRRTSDQVLAEIDAGSVDGVQEGWMMTIGVNGQFVANLRIIEVDLRRSTGIVTLEDASRGSVEIGNKAYAYPE